MALGSTIEVKQVSLTASRPVWSLIAGLFALILAMGSYWLQTVYAEGQATKAATQATQRRVDTVEERLKNIEASQRRIEDASRDNFDKLDRKLDALITRELEKRQ